jgi:hypothetical protein
MINDFALNSKGILKKGRSAARVQRVQKVQRVQRGRLTGLRPEGCGRLPAAGCGKGFGQKVLKGDAYIDPPVVGKP